MPERIAVAITPRQIIFPIAQILVYAKYKSSSVYQKAHAKLTGVYFSFIQCSLFG
jgi:hypothetical protein